MKIKLKTKVEDPIYGDVDCYFSALWNDSGAGVGGNSMI